jgi:AcrR family transcriptional regulator
MSAKAAEPTSVRLLTIATDHVRRFGARRTTVVAIAEEAGMTHANVYRYFPSKEALVDAVIGEWLKEVEGAVVGVTGAPDPADDKLERIILAYTKAQRDLLEREPNLFALYISAVEKRRAVIRRHRGRMRALVERVAEEGINTDHFAWASADKLVQFVFDATWRFLDPHAVHADRDIPRKAIDGRLERVMKAVMRATKSDGFRGA